MPQKKYEQSLKRIKLLFEDLKDLFFMFFIVIPGVCIIIGVLFNYKKALNADPSILKNIWISFQVGLTLSVIGIIVNFVCELVSSINGSNFRFKHSSRTYSPEDYKSSLIEAYKLILFLKELISFPILRILNR